jgi:phage gp36-like protein
MDPTPLAATYTDIHQLSLAQPEILAVVPQEQAEQAAALAEAEINGHLAKLYTLPLTGTVPLLTTIATDIAIHRIWMSRKFSNPPRPIEDGWIERYKAAIAMLLRVAAGEMLLVTDAGVIIQPSATTASAWSSTMNYSPTFGEGDDRGFFVSRDKLEAENARRGF